PPNTLALLIRQVAAGNVSCAEVAQMAGGRFTAAAYCTARKRLPLEVVQACAARVYESAAAARGGGASGRQQQQQGRWRGHLALLMQAGLHGLFPVHHKRIVDFTPGRPHVCEGAAGAGAGAGAAGVPRSRWVRSLGRDDQLVEWFKPQARPDWMDQQRYAAL